MLNRNRPACYCIPAKAYEALLERFDDLELQAIADEREGQSAHPISLEPPSKAAVIFLPPTAGKVKGSIVTSVMAGVACGDGVAGIGVNSQILNDIRPLRYIHPPRKNSVVNKMG